MEDKIKVLEEEVGYYKGLYNTVARLNELQHETIQKQHKIFMLQEAELQKLRGDTK